MLRGPLSDPQYRPRFSGHETFPLRYGWLKKAFDAVEQSNPGEDNKWVFNREDAIARFGVGKNMVASMRHWAMSAGILHEANDRIRSTDLGMALFSDKGIDPFMEHPATLWIVHWELAGKPTKTTWYWAFNYFPDSAFDRENLANSVISVAGDMGWPRAAESTIKKDVACFIRTYVSQELNSSLSHEDGLESPLAELGLIAQEPRGSGFRFSRGPKETLGLGAFCYGLNDFWSDRFNYANTLTLETLAFEPGSPGRVFLLDEAELIEMMFRLEEITHGRYSWTESAGLKQLSRQNALSNTELFDLLKHDYESK